MAPKTKLYHINSVNELSKQDLYQMFDRFYKADETKTGKGTGLGLPIVKCLMGKMDGSLTPELENRKLENLPIASHTCR